MGRMTLADFRTEVASGLQRGSETDIGTTKLDAWVNNTVREFAYAFKFRELEDKATFVTVDGQYEYAIGTHIVATGFRSIHDLGLWKNAPEERIGKLLNESRQQWLKNIGDVTASAQRGAPKYYHKFGNSVYLRPVPDSTLVTVTFHFWKKVTPLTAPAHTTQFDEDWDEIVVIGAQARGLRNFGEFDRYQNVRNDFLGMVRSRVLETDLEEFPEGSVNPVGWHDTEGTLENG